MTVAVPDRILRVDLSAGTVESEPVPDRWLERYLGGKGLGVRYLYDAVPAGADPLGQENALLFMSGPLSGLLPGEVRYAAVTKSPLTGTFLDSYSGGEFASSLVGALGAHVGVLITGQADEPTVLAVEDGTAELRTRPDLWGSDAVEIDDAFPDWSVAGIGPAGEHEVHFATVASDGGDHQAGRGGAGAVMGAKRLKAVVARGERPDALADLRAEYAERYSEDDTGRWQAAGGTVETIDFADEVGVLPSRGWQDGRFEGTDDVGIEAVKAAATEREREDAAVPGGFRVETEDGDHIPRGATPMTLGAGLGIDDFDAVATLGETCDRLGLDVISAGNAVAWAVRAGDAGYLDRSPSFGDGEAARELIEEIARREGSLGEALAEGVDAAGERFGGGELIPTVKSAELPAYDPRGTFGMTLAYATSDRGACHRRARPVEVEPFEGEAWTDADRVEVVYHGQTVRSVLWSLVADDFVGELLWDDLGAEWLRAVGLEYTPTELYRVGQRVWTLARLFNVREGFDRSDDALPKLFARPLADGSERERAIDVDRFQSLLSRYYAARGWSREGIPSEPVLERLDLLGAVDEHTPVAEEPIAPDHGGA
ncbi:MAG: aldehyde ferredoxin oxidoreductase C-terminal domain-containing protein [Halobacteriales archaeon]